MNKAKGGLKKIKSFGEVAAENDDVLKYFTATSAVARVLDPMTFLVTGRKGMGKTAIVRYFTEGFDKDTSLFLTLKSYPWRVHSELKDYGASDAEVYVASWKYIICLKVACLSLANSKKKNKDSKSLEAFLKTNYGGFNPSLASILEVKELRVEGALEPTVLGCKLGSIKFSGEKGNRRFGIDMDALSEQLYSASIRLASENGIKSLCLHFDELDYGMSKLDDERKNMLIGLILASKDVCYKSNKSDGVRVKAMIYMRSDIWAQLRFSDKNKITKSQMFDLRWDGDQLKALVGERIKAILGPDYSWDDLDDGELMRGSQSKWNHIVTRTFERPRDVIAFLNSSLEIAAKSSHDVFENKDIVSARESYSSYLKLELDDEINAHWSDWERTFAILSRIGKLVFDKDEFVAAYNREFEKPVLSAEDSLAKLFEFSVIAYEKRSGYGGSDWLYCFKDSVAGWNVNATRFKVHPGLKECAGLNEERLRNS